MILVDTSVWVDHLRVGDADMQRALDAAEVFIHPYVIGEIALGQLPRRALILDLLATLPVVPVVSTKECLTFVERHHLFGRGIGYVDVHLLASAALAHETRLWTRDRRLFDAAAALGVGLLHSDRLH